MAWRSLYYWFIPWRKSGWFDAVSWYKKYLYDAWFDSLPVEQQNKLERQKEEQQRESLHNARTSLAFMAAFTCKYGGDYV